MWFIRDLTEEYVNHKMIVTAIMKFFVLLSQRCSRGFFMEAARADGGSGNSESMIRNCSQELFFATSYITNR